MKKRILMCVCLVAVLIIMQNRARCEETCIAPAPSLEFGKVIGNVYVGRQTVPLAPLLGSDYCNTYSTVNLYAIASEDKSEIVLIDAPMLDINGAFLTALLDELAAEFNTVPRIKAVLLTHDHLDHCGAIADYVASAIPVYASKTEIHADPGPGGYDMPLADFADSINPINPGDRIAFDGAVIEAVDLSGHTPGHMGYAYFPKGEKGGKINWFFAGDVVMAPPTDYAEPCISPNPEENTGSCNYTFFIRYGVLQMDTFDFASWKNNLHSLKQRMTRHAKLFPGHGPVRKGIFWQEPMKYIDHTIGMLQPFLSSSNTASEP